MSTSGTFTVKFLQAGATGAKGAALRGPQAWSDCAVGYEFQAGGDDESFIDVVMYNDNYYYCKTSHTKTASNYPLSTTSETNNLWQLGDKIGLVATTILLAEYAKINNLGASAIEMTDDDGNVLVSIKDGSVVCKIGDFENITVTNAKVSGVFSQDIRTLYLGGTVIGDSVTLTAEKISNLIDDYDQFELNSSSTQALPTTSSLAGRTITIYANANVTLTSTSNIVYGGSNLSSLFISNEYVELKAITNGTVVDWVVLNKGFLNPTYVYGVPPCTIAMGWAARDGGSNYIYLFTGDKITISSTGYYTYLTFPKSYVDNINDLYVQVTNKGYSTVVASVNDVTTSGSNVIVAIQTGASIFGTNVYLEEFYIEIRNIRQFITS